MCECVFFCGFIIMRNNSTNFCLSSTVRNRFLQPPTGLFGGDEWCLCRDGVS